MKKFVLTTILLGFYSASAPAALASEDVATQHVSYADLDLTTVAGRDRLDRRIARAVQTVCGGDDERNLGMLIAQSKCRRAAWTGTRTHVALAVLSAKRRLAGISGEGPQTVRVELRR